MCQYSFYEKENVSLYLSELELIDDFSSALQSVRLYNHPSLGKTLIINDEIQHIEKWIPYYHESIVHIPMMFIPTAKNVLILGGGDLFALVEVLKYPTIEQIFLCDYDENVIKLTNKYYKHAKNALANKKVNIIIEDARNYIKECNIKFDLIIDDCFNLVETYDSSDIFQSLKNMLTKDGVCSSLVYRHIFDDETMKKTFSRLVSTQNTVVSLVTVPEYPGILHLLTMWGTSRYLNQNLNKTVNSVHNSNTHFPEKCNLFDYRFCSFYLYLPRYLKNQLCTEESLDIDV